MQHSITSKESELRRENEELKKGLNTIGDKIVYKGVSDAFNMPLSNADDFLK